MQSHLDQFHALSELLSRYKGDWQLMPFTQATWPWPEMAGLEAFSADELDALDLDGQSALIEPYRPGLFAWMQTELGAFAAEGPEPLARLSVGMKGRKWQQITDFSQAVRPVASVLEWCAGKGHLGRVYASQGHAVKALELQADLCEQGREQARHWQLDHQFVCADALSADAAQYVRQDQHAMALHACGDLHSRLLQLAVKAGTEAVSISPCCYHLIATEHYQPLSSAGRQWDLTLTPFDLRLPLQELVTGGERASRLRHLEQQYRLGFDALQRALTGVDAYLPVPNAPKSLFTGDFAGFARWAADKKGLVLPAGINWQHYLALGQARQQVVRRMDWVRHWYRKPLELWLLLDRVCFLEEAGYQVSLGTFTDKQHTPRNALIDARRGRF
ncbi:MAG: methyltransferase [Pseudomonadota bacterium]|uniref:methyltransferase n=1 Tax=Gallaecimonas pentaromativorans TaxID=584787 RepID=UPI00067F0D3B|nr:methyltransferase [Gallaecimonas pentaromativorans]MED5525500.1 methyltransferase [Pseudomonadota bacterium]